MFCNFPKQVVLDISYPLDFTLHNLVKFLYHSVGILNMTYELIICEKPQAAQKIADALSTGKLKKHSESKVPYYEIDHDGKKIIVAAAVGHLFGLGEKDKKEWTYPVFSIEWKPSSVIHKGHFSKKYADVLKKLSKDSSEITVATDYDVEGEVIGLNIVRYICKKKDANRMKFSTLVKKDIVESYKNKQKTLNWGQAFAGETRHILDWYWGINLSRALTLSVKKSRGGFKVLSAGRVQGPALKLIVEREKEISKFISKPYWQMRADVIKDENKFESWHVEDKFFDENSAEKIYKSISKEKNAKVSDIKRISTNQSPPIPFDLTTLQTEAHKTCGISPKDTLDIAQNLYTQGFISYPRTSSQKLPPQLGLRSIIQELSKQTVYSSLAKNLLAKKTLTPHEGKKEDDAHPSIYPTGIAPKDLKGRESKLYDLIVRRFLSVFGDPALRETMKVNLLIKDQNFLVEGTRTKEKGWHIYYEPYLKLKEIDLPDFKKNEILNLDKIELLKKETQPPKRYTDSSIIRALEKSSIGTKSTRAQIIETLKERGYVLKDGSLTASTLGIKTEETLEKHAPKILDEELTRHFEEEMEDIRKGKRDKDKVISEAESVLVNILEDFKKEESQIGNDLKESENQSYQESNRVGTCKSCGKGFLMIRKSKYGQFIGCSNYPECKQTFSLPKDQKVNPSGRVCSECGYPTVFAKAPRSKEQEVCISPKCISWTKEYQAKKKSEIAADA